MTKLLYILSKHVYVMSLQNNGRSIAIFEKLKDIQIGDIVFENSRGYDIEYEEFEKRIGYLHKKLGYSEFLIKSIYDNKIYRWENSEFIKVPTDFNILLNKDF